MLKVESELTAAIYILYCIDCTHWLKSGEMALTRQWGGRWKAHFFQEDAYTLFGRMPVLVNPLDLRPSFVSGPAIELEPLKQTIPNLILRCNPDTKVITFLSLLGAVNLLIVLPALLVTGYLGMWWRIPLFGGLSIHFCLTFEIYEQAAPWRAAHPNDFWQQFVSLALSPLAALRSGDVLFRGLVRTRGLQS